ncbi:MAG: hypothetical protein R3B60_03805 [Candidatus Paceibacterota bacterium]
MNSYKYIALLVLLLTVFGISISTYKESDFLTDLWASMGLAEKCVEAKLLGIALGEKEGVSIIVTVNGNRINIKSDRSWNDIMKFVDQGNGSSDINICSRGGNNTLFWPESIMVDKRNLVPM